jgi:hypothetical protein
VVAGYVGMTTDLIGCTVTGVTVKNSHVTGSVNNLGGFIGVTDYAGAVFEDCTIEGGSVVPSANIRYVGGFVANINKGANFKRCTVKDVTIDAGGSNRVGGFAVQAGRYDGYEITQCVVENVTMKGGQNSAGFVGVNYFPNINKCAVIGGAITAGNTQVGGFAGYPEGNASVKCQMTDCYSTMKVEGGSRANIGGFIGIAKGLIVVKNCYAAGEVSGTNEKTGIFAGSVDVNTAAISSCIGWSATLPFAGTVVDGAENVKDNYVGNEGTISSQATALGWSTDVWDLGGDAPTLK